MSQPAVLHIRGTDLYGSPERLIIGQMQHLSEIHSVAASFVKPGTDNRFLKEVTKAGMEAVEIADYGGFDRKIPARIREIVGRFKVELIVTHEYKSSVYGYLACRKLHVPQICYFHGWTSEDRKVRFYNWVDRQVLRRAERVVTVSKASAARLVDNGVPEANIEVVYNAIDVDLNEAPPERTPNEAPVIGVVGRLSHEKGLHHFIDAITELHRQEHEFRARIIGSGPDEAKLRQMAAQDGLDEIVTFEGFRDDLDVVYPQLDFLVLPSLSEGHPVVILEAWKHAVGVVATRAGGIPEVVEHERNGLLTEIGRPDLLAATIARALNDLPLMNHFGRVGFEEVRTKYSYPKQAEQLHRVYTETIRRKRDGYA